MKPFIQLTKPGITLFIGITAAAGFITSAASGGISAWRFVACVAATMLMSGGAAAMNQIAERNSDALMLRTARRPLPGGVISLHSARAFAWGMTGTGLTLSVLSLPWLATLLLVASHVSYVNIYTPLKRRTALCTLAGAVPGALPVLVGCAAAGVPIGRAGYALAGLLFAWQIPHFLAIGWIAREDYARASCPMLSVTDPSGRDSAEMSLLYAFGTLVFALIIAFTAPVGILYPAIALAAGTGYVAAAFPMRSVCDRASARRLFFASLLVLPLMLAALMLDLLVLA